MLQRADAVGVQRAPQTLPVRGATASLNRGNAAVVSAEERVFYSAVFKALSDGKDAVEGAKLLPVLQSSQLPRNVLAAVWQCSKEGAHTGLQLNELIRAFRLVSLMLEQDDKSVMQVQQLLPQVLSQESIAIPPLNFPVAYPSKADVQERLYEHQKASLSFCIAPNPTERERFVSLFRRLTRDIPNARLPRVAAAKVFAQAPKLSPAQKQAFALLGDLKKQGSYSEGEFVATLTLLQRAPSVELKHLPLSLVPLLSQDEQKLLLSQARASIVEDCINKGGSVGAVSVTSVPSVPRNHHRTPSTRSVSSTHSLPSTPSKKKVQETEEQLLAEKGVLMGQNRLLQPQIDAERKELQEREARVAPLRAEVLLLRQEHAEKQRVFGELREKTDAADDELSTLRQETTQLQSEIQKLTRAITQIRAEAEKRQLEIDNLRAEREQARLLAEQLRLQKEQEEAALAALEVENDVFENVFDAPAEDFAPGKAHEKVFETSSHHSTVSHEAQQPETKPAEALFEDFAVPAATEDTANAASSSGGFDAFSNHDDPFANVEIKSESASFEAHFAATPVQDEPQLEFVEQPVQQEQQAEELIEPVEQQIVHGVDVAAETFDVAAFVDNCDDDDEDIDLGIDMDMDLEIDALDADVAQIDGGVSQLNVVVEPAPELGEQAKPEEEPSSAGADAWNDFDTAAAAAAHDSAADVKSNDTHDVFGSNDTSDDPFADASPYVETHNNPSTHEEQQKESPVTTDKNDDPFGDVDWEASPVPATPEPAAAADVDWAAF
ncbi:MAG: hypothetical protein MHM6MM_001032 [Cercozoa sp. M6MM]